MSQHLKISLLAGILIYLIIIVICIKKNKIALKYSLLWFLSVFLLIIMVAFPSLIQKITFMMGIEMPINTVFIVFIFLILLILISLTIIVSKQNQQIKKLTQTVGILERKIKDSEN